MNNGQKYLNEEIEGLQIIQKQINAFSLQKHPKIETHLQEINKRIQLINKILDDQDMIEQQYQQMRKKILNDNSQKIGKNIEQDIIYTYNLELLSQRQSIAQSIQEIPETCHSVIIKSSNLSTTHSEQQKEIPQNNFNQQNQKLSKSNEQFNENLLQSNHLSSSYNEQQKQVDTDKPLKNYHLQNQQSSKNRQQFDQNLLQSQNPQSQSQYQQQQKDDDIEMSEFKSCIENQSQISKLNKEIQPKDNLIQPRSDQFEQTEQKMGEKYDTPSQSDDDGDDQMHSAISSFSKIEQFKQKQQLQNEKKDMAQVLYQEKKAVQDQMDIEDSKSNLTNSQKMLNKTKQIKRNYQYQIKQELFTKMKDDMIQFKMNIVQQPQILDDGSTNQCPICFDECFADSDIQDRYVISLSCSHQFHYVCIQPLLNNKFLKCPVCNQLFGQQKGDQPDGTMDFTYIRKKCAGFNCDTIQITYTFPSGVRNGQHYTGTVRYAFLPNNGEGKYVLNLLKQAFKQKLIFTIGTSLTTGQQNCVIWNGIHHKTSLDGGPTNYGYPDPTYFDRVIDELKQKGVILIKE